MLLYRYVHLPQFMQMMINLNSLVIIHIRVFYWRVMSPLLSNSSLHVSSKICIKSLRVMKDSMTFREENWNEIWIKFDKTCSNNLFIGKSHVWVFRVGVKTFTLTSKNEYLMEIWFSDQKNKINRTIYVRYSIWWNTTENKIAFLITFPAYIWRHFKKN